MFWKVRGIFGIARRDLGEETRKFSKMLSLVIWACLEYFPNAIIMAPLLQKLVSVSNRISFDEILKLWEI